LQKVEAIKDHLDDSDVFIWTEIRINLIHQISWHYMILNQQKNNAGYYENVKGQVLT
jgi:hypothetical protein